MKLKHGFLLILVCLVSSASAQYIISGTVNNSTGSPVPFASIRLLNTGYSIITDTAGKFEIKNVGAGSYSLVVSSTGYEAQYSEISIPGSGAEFNITLHTTRSMLEPVIVTSFKREEILQRLPVTVTAITSKAIDDFRLWNVSDLSTISPNLYASHPGDNRNVTAIRGITNTSYEQSVITYVDGVNQFNLDTYIPQLFEVERIEILKGPQGTLYGRNAMGGVLSIHTKKPGNVSEGFAEASIGNYNSQRYTASIRLPVVQDKLFFGAAGLYQSTNGFYTNAFNNSHYDKGTSGIGNYYLKFLPVSKWAVTANLKHSHNRNRGAFPLVFSVEEAFKNPYRLNQNAITKMIDDVFNASLSVNHFGKRFLFNSVTAFQSNRRYYQSPIDADFSPLDAISIFNDFGGRWNKVKAYTQEINFQPASTAQKFRWLAGSYLFLQQNPVKQRTLFGPDAAMAGAPDQDFSLTTSNDLTSKGAAFFGQFTYAFSKKFEVTGGLRYDFENRKQSVSGDYEKPPDPAFPFRTDTSAAADFNALSPKLTLAYFPSVDQTIYLNYSRGFRAGGLTPLSLDPSQPALFNYDPEFSDNIEAGWKKTTDNKKLYMNLAVFYSQISDVQVPTLLLPDAVTITKNTGSLNSKGAEAEVKWSALKNLLVDYSFGYTDAKYTSLVLSQGGAQKNAEGNRQLFTPDVTSRLGLSYKHPLAGSKFQLVLNGEWKYTGDQYFDLANSIRQSSYHLFNGAIGIDVNNASIGFWIKNISGEKYITYGYDFGAVRLGNPMTYGVQASVRF